MLDVTPIKAGQPKGLPPKTVLIEKAAANLGRSQQFFQPNLAVNFGAPGRTKRNKFGVDQAGCTHCGECDIGCNIHAKNTLDLNYLAVADSGGPALPPSAKPSTSQRGPTATRSDSATTPPGKTGRSARQRCSSARARSIPLNCGCAAGTSTVHCRTCPNGSATATRRTGTSWPSPSTPSPSPIGLPRAPTITTAIVDDDRSTTDRTWFVFEDGGCPPEVATLVLQVLSRDGRWHADGALAGTKYHAPDVNRLWKSLPGWSTTVTARPSSWSWAVTGLPGAIQFLPGVNQVRVRWDVPVNLPLYVLESAFCDDVASELGGQYVASPAWQYLGQPERPTTSAAA